MKVDWAALGAVFGVSIVVVLGLVLLFSIGLRGVSAREAAREGGQSGVNGTIAAAISFAACAAVVLFGLYLIVAA
ncbi:hypothetical protein [Umezawaea sp. Da 62-37]|uniref:hypothetical protein n=1 Tax=Umezawaea sp. Da 62-37 TaxID=3075927 RepID=UPI0028F6E5D9|nr:hypothetical protein [Umezawaea sp. Da 62-37]WNV82560.1 hypothetical protein RM788_30700 [Umezawaea sp. Da 62-37]